MIIMGREREHEFDADAEWYNRMAQVRERLKGLRRFRTVSDFLRGYYEIVLAHLEHLAPYGVQWLKAFQALLEYETWRHKSIVRIRNTQDSRVILALGIEMRRALFELLRRLERMYPQNSYETIVLQLLRAECLYQLGQTREVISALDQAVAAGCEHPLIYFALGFNMYRHALQEYVEVDPHAQRAIIRNRQEFEDWCERAIGAFRSGISPAETSPMDAQLYFWIGIVYETLGRRDDAREAYGKVADIAPELSNEVMPRLERLERMDAELQSSGESTLPSPDTSAEVERLGRITDEELARMSDLLSNVDTLSELLKRSKETGEN